MMVVEVKVVSDAVGEVSACVMREEPQVTGHRQASSHTLLFPAGADIAQGVSPNVAGLLWSSVCQRRPLLYHAMSFSG